MWREDWLRRQIKELEEVEAEQGKAYDECVEAKRNRPLIPPAPDAPAAGGGWRTDGPAPAAAWEGGGEGEGKGVKGRGEERCAREENWGAALATRRKVTLVHSTIPVHQLPKGSSAQMLFDPRKRRASNSAMMAVLQKHQQIKQQQQQQQLLSVHDHTQQSNVTRQGGSVLSKQGTKLITETGQKLVIKFTGEPPSQGRLSMPLLRVSMNHNSAFRAPCCR